MDSVADCPGVCSQLSIQDVKTNEVPRRGETTSSTSPSTCSPKRTICCARSSQLHRMISLIFFFR